jgi:hypothetical protein
MESGYRPARARTPFMPADVSWVRGGAIGWTSAASSGRLPGSWRSTPWKPTGPSASGSRPLSGRASTGRGSRSGDRASGLGLARPPAPQSARRMECDRWPEGQVVGAVDLTHHAPALRRDTVVTAGESGAGGEALAGRGGGRDGMRGHRGVRVEWVGPGRLHGHGTKIPGSVPGSRRVRVPKPGKEGLCRPFSHDAASGSSRSRPGRSLQDLPQRGHPSVPLDSAEFARSDPTSLHLPDPGRRMNSGIGCAPPLMRGTVRYSWTKSRGPVDGSRGFPDK